MRLEHTVETLRLATPLRISRGAMSERDAVRLTLSDDRGHGRGEVVTSPRLGVDAESVARALTRVADWMGADDAVALRARLPELRAALPEALPMVAAVDCAVHDYLATVAGVPLCDLLGLPRWDHVPTAYTVGLGTVEEAAASAARVTTTGFTVLKVKVGVPDPAADIARVRAVRAAAPAAALLLDPNGAWDAPTAIEVLAALTDCAPAALEQPVPARDLDGLARVAAALAVPVIADEAAARVADLSALPPGIAGVNVKLAECGGLDAALAMIEWAAAARVGVMLGCLVGSSLSIAPAAHLTGIARWVDLDGHLLLADDPWHGLGGADGTLRRPAGPGLGVTRR
ncbi:enolase C-terminal domain-like protein [Nocardia takedensis]